MLLLADAAAENKDGACKEISYIYSIALILLQVYFIFIFLITVLKWILGLSSRSFILRF